MNCPWCSSEVADDARFCSACGVELPRLLRADSSSRGPEPPPDVPPPPVGAPVTAGAAVYPPAAPPPYPPPYLPVARARSNGLAIASLVLGILWLYWIGSLLALIFGYVAKSQIERSGGTQGGRGMAIAGIVLGWVGVALLVVAVVVVATASDYYQ